MTGDGVHDEIDVRAFWGPRQEGVGDCADRLRAFLARIADRDDALARWFRTGESRREALSRPVETDLPWLTDWLKTEGPTYDDDQNLMQDLGFSVDAWNGDGDGTASFYASCGGWTRYVNNRCILSAHNAPAHRLWQPATARALVTDLVECWQPDIVTVSCFDQYGDLPRALRWYDPGWLTYLGPERAALLPAVPDSTSSTPLDGGLLLQLKTDPAQTTTEHLLDLRDALGPAIERPQQTWRRRMRNTADAVTRLVRDSEIGRNRLVEEMHELLELARTAHDPQTAELVETVKAIENTATNDELHDHLDQLRNLLAEENDPYHRT